MVKERCDAQGSPLEGMGGTGRMGGAGGSGKGWAVDSEAEDFENGLNGCRK